MIGPLSNPPETPRKRGRRFRNVVLSAAISIIAVSAVWFSYTVYRTHEIYDLVKRQSRGWRGAVHAYDPERGFAPVPGAKGVHLFAEPPYIPMRYDKDGLRVPYSDDSPATANAGPVLLALGCSFTYGDGCRAEDAYVYRLAQKLGGTAKNAGVCSYGLQGMVQQAERLIPLFEPDYVLVQHSPWLADRAVTPFASVYYGAVPVPYYSGEPGPGLTLAPPVFPTNNWDVPYFDYRDTDRGATDFASFLFRVGVPLYRHLDWHFLALGLRRAMGRVPQPATDRGAVYRLAYSRIQELCAAYGARMVVFTLGAGETDRWLEPSTVETVTSARVADVNGGLWAELPDTSAQSYLGVYGIPLGRPAGVIDPHPNAHAHEMIARLLAESIEAMEEVTRSEE